MQQFLRYKTYVKRPYGLGSNLLDGQAAFGPELDAHSMLMVRELAKLEIVEVGSIAESVVCDANLNQDCPSGLQVKGNDGETMACKRRCTAYHAPEYCCTGQFQNPNTCKPTNYSQYFKSGCSHSYSYAFDDASSTFTCPEANYLISFC
ncbi:thaumatin-like protein [Tanacetum coccineum]